MSTLARTGDRIIVHTGKTLRITSEGYSRTASLEYILDGLEHTYVTQAGSRIRYRAILDGNSLRIRGTLTSKSVVDHPIDHKYVLSDDNTILTHITTIASPIGPIVRKEVFRKQ